MRLMLLTLLSLAGCGGCASIPGWTEQHDSTHRLEFAHGICSGTSRPGNVILTAQHCLDHGGPLLSVDGHPVTVTGIGRDKHDTLTLRIKGYTLTHWARLGSLPKQGDRIHWWGNPKGAPDIYREGYVSGVYEGMVMIDATICHGDSGAGIFNSAGEVVGVVTGMNDEAGCTFMMAYPLPTA